MTNNASPAKLADWDVTPKPKAKVNDVIIMLRDAGIGYDMVNKTLSIHNVSKFERWRKLAMEWRLTRVIKT